MSIFDLPRLHFTGIGVSRLPTGPRYGLVDVASNTALTEAGPFPVERPAHEYHRYLSQLGNRIDPDGATAEDGCFSLRKGWNFGGNSHFWIDASITAVELEAGRISTVDPIVGRQVDLWGHYNDYLSTTANRARIYDVDPMSNWTTTVMIGQMALGRLGRSHEVGYVAIGEVRDVSAPRWQNPRHVLTPEPHPWAAELNCSVTYQFVVDSADQLDWFDDPSDSAGLAALREGADDGLLVQLALSAMATPQQNDAPNFWHLHGTIAPWHRDEMRTTPEGRLLTARRHRDSELHVCTVRVDEVSVTANLISAIPVVSRALNPGPGPLHTLGGLVDLGDLVLRTAEGRPIAVFERSCYTGYDYRLRAGVLTTARIDGQKDDPEEALAIATIGGRILMSEETTAVHVDCASLIVDFPNRTSEDSDVAKLNVHSLVRGLHRRVTGISAEQYFNPKALARDPIATAVDARVCDRQIVDFVTESGPQKALIFDTDERGRAVLAIRGHAPGATRVLLRPRDLPAPCSQDRPGSAGRAYDNDDELRYWSATGTASVRVLPDHWYLDNIPDDEVTFDLVYREVYAYYELMYSFMSKEIMSLADEGKACTHARMIRLMCDPKCKNATFYMPSTRELSQPQTNLLSRFMRRIEAGRQLPADASPAPAKVPVIATRDELHVALRHAATIELAVMLQYLYALWSLPTYSAGSWYVDRGVWTPERLHLICGPGPDSLNAGMRGTLLGVAREEMMHFLAINNIITATGQPFHLPSIDFNTINEQLPVQMGLCLEPLNPGSLQRFIALERPFDIVPNFEPHGQGSAIGSPSELYAAIRSALQRIPDLFLVDRGRGGGEHHLFMRRSLNTSHPDYQVEVDDIASAVFAIDFVTEHGEGHVIDHPGTDESSHYEVFLDMAEELGNERFTGAGGRSLPWDPAYPLARNPTLRTNGGVGDPITDGRARHAVALFNRCYALTMRMMVQHFTSSPDTSLRRSRLMNASLDLMTGVLRPIAEHIVTLPSGRPGRLAGPSFELLAPVTAIARPDVALRWFARELTEVSETAYETTGLVGSVGAVLRSFAEQFDAMSVRDLQPG